MTDTNQITKIFMCSLNDYVTFTYDKDESCESSCRKICILLKFTPMVEHLFGIRKRKRILDDPELWIAPCRTLEPNVEYEFRLRFEVHSLQFLLDNCNEAFAFYYAQVRYDVLNDLVEEFKYPRQKDQVMGLCITDMYRAIIEDNIKLEDMKKYCKQYVPKRMYENHKLFMKPKIKKNLASIRNYNFPSIRVKEIYLKDVHKLAPNYLCETYKVVTTENPHARVNPLEIKTKISVHNGKMQIHLNPCQEIPLEELCDVGISEEGGFRIEVQLKNEPVRNWYRFETEAQMESFISCLAGYYRLTVCWTTSLCKELSPPSLAILKVEKCHGPIGGIFAAKKLERAGNRPGQYILRQCEQNFNTLYIDIVRKVKDIRYADPHLRCEEGEREIFRIIRHSDSCFVLHTDDGNTEKFDSLVSLAQSIPLESRIHERIPPSDFDRPLQLLPCLPKEQIVVPELVQDLSMLNSAQSRVIRFESLVLYKEDSRQHIRNYPLIVVNGEWILPKTKKISVTVKRLTSDRYLTEMINLADRWCAIECHAIARLYGVVLGSPNRCLVFEDMSLGPLNVLLQQNSNRVTLKSLIHAAHLLSIAVQYLRTHDIIHTRIRCSSIWVVKFAFDVLETKLGDPGIDRPYSQNDKLFIPIEYQDDLEGAKHDKTTDLWAFATTLHEIFSYGYRVKLSNDSIRKMGGCMVLEPPQSIQQFPELYKIMCDGWDTDRDARFDFQMITSKLNAAYDKLNKTYADVPDVSEQTTSTTSYVPHNGHSSLSDSERGSDSTLYIKRQIHETLCFNGDGDMNGDDDYDEESVNSYDDSCREADGGLIDRNKSNLFFDTLVNKKISTHTGSITFLNELGSGNFGTVFRGSWEIFKTSQVRDVALKVLQDRSVGPCDALDIKREAEIMRQLKHPNIVEILNVVEYPMFVIVMELIKEGPFSSYLQNNAFHLTVNRLLKFAKGIASGMEYLEKMKVIHRDLAARNILVVNHEYVKISDFGLAQPSEGGYYLVKTNFRLIPIKWYAPESMCTSKVPKAKFSHASDVWSFGVTMYEAFSHGQRPWPEDDPITAEKLYGLLEAGIRMSRPKYCPREIYSALMEECWAFDFHERPNFTQILEKINEFVEEYMNNIEYNTTMQTFN